jgi:hypothetical protein
MSEVSKLYTKECLTAVDDALVRSATKGTQTTILYRRKGQLDIRVKVDLTPPSNVMNPLIYEEAP